MAEAEADEVHLVLSSAGSGGSLVRTAEQFAAVGPTSLVLTKLDEVASLGHLLPLIAPARLPLSYVTDGQNVPDDIAAGQQPPAGPDGFGIGQSADHNRANRHSL